MRDERRCVSVMHRSGRKRRRARKRRCPVRRAAASALRRKRREEGVQLLVPESCSSTTCSLSLPSSLPLSLPLPLSLTPPSPLHAVTKYLTHSATFQPINFSLFNLAVTYSHMSFLLITPHVSGVGMTCSGLPETFNFIQI